MDDQAFKLLCDELKSLREDIKGLRDSVSKLYLKIALIAGASGVAGGKLSTTAPKVTSFLAEVYHFVVG